MSRLNLVVGIVLTLEAHNKIQEVFATVEFTPTVKIKIAKLIILPSQVSLFSYVKIVQAKCSDRVYESYAKAIQENIVGYWAVFPKGISIPASEELVQTLMRMDEKNEQSSLQYLDELSARIEDISSIFIT